MQRMQKIKVHSPSPYENIDSGTEEWLKQLRLMWPQLKKSKAMSDMLYSFFNQSENPFKAALSIMVSSGDFYLGKHNSLAFEIIMNFSKWMQSQNISDIPKPLKVDAVTLVTKQHNTDLIKLVIETFRVKEDSEMIVGHIRELVKKQKYKEVVMGTPHLACQLASFLNLHENFRIEEFVVPLIFQDKYRNVEVFLNGSKRHQLELAVFLDNIIGKQSVTQESLNIVGNLNVPDVRFTFMKYKPLSKLLTKIVKTYNLPPTTCPNMNRKKGKGVLHFLLHKRYIEKTISGDSWTEMMLEALGNDENLQEELIDNLVFYRELKEAVAWAERLGIPKERWPRRLLEYCQSESEEGNVEAEPPPKENWDDVEEPSPLNYHKFPLDESQIKVIDTAAGFKDFIAAITEGVSVVGIDAEWKPSFGFKPTDLAVIQVATFDVVYILDVIALSSAGPLPLWERFANFLFEDPRVLKIGFGTGADLQIVKDTFRKLHCLKSVSDVGFLDLSVLWQTLVCNYKFVFPFPSTSSTSANLSRLIEMCLGQSLDKSDQFSNWENRPLRRSQILYAAIDAYCLLEAYDVMVKEAKSQNIPISDIIEEILLDTRAKKTKKRGVKHQNE